MTFVTACTEYLRDAIEEEQARSPAVRYSGVVVECRALDWRLALHMRSTSDAQDDADFASWDLSHLAIAEDQSFLDAPAEALSRAIDRGDEEWIVLYERIVCDVSRAMLALEDEGIFRRPPFVTGTVYYVCVEDEPGAETARARLGAIREGTLTPGWSARWLR